MPRFPRGAAPGPVRSWWAPRAGIHQECRARRAAGRDNSPRSWLQQPPLTPSGAGRASPPAGRCVPAPTTNRSREPGLRGGPSRQRHLLLGRLGLGLCQALLRVKDAGAWDGEPRRVRSVIEGSLQSLTGGGRSRSGGCGAARGAPSPAQASSHPLSPAGGALLPACGPAARRRAAGLWLCFPALSPHRLPSPSPTPSRSRLSLSFHDVIRWKSAMLRDWNNPALTRGAGSGARGRRRPRSLWARATRTCRVRITGVKDRTEEGECGQGGRAGGKSPGRKVQSLLQRFLTWCVVRVGRKFP